MAHFFLPPPTAFRGGMLRLGLAMVVAGAIALWPATCPAATFEGLDIVVESQWPGCGHGGYFPVRINVVNKGNPRTLRFDCASQHDPMPSVSRTIQADTGRVALHLLVPCVNHQNSATLRVAVDGRYVDVFTTPVRLPNSRGSDEQGPAVLLISDRDTDWGNYQLALDAIVTAGSSGGSSHYSTPKATQDHQFVHPATLPKEWLAYTGLDLAAVSETTLAGLPAEVRGALLKWVATGGNLLVFELQGDAADGVEGLPSSLAAMETVIELNGAADRNATWERHGSGGGGRSGSGRYFIRSSIHGRILAVEGDPFREFNQGQWDHLLRTLGRNRWEWIERNGFTARHPANEFMEFLIPSVRGVPVIAFLVLITIFAVVIGPVNYVYLWRKQRLYLLVVSIPLIALATSLSLFAYSAVAHGFATRGRIRSLTVLDQGKNSLVQTSRLSLYSGLAPSEGLRFSRDSAVYPIWPPDGGFESGAVDWTRTQHLQSGWLRSRTRTQFLVTTHRDERGRLEITPAGSQLQVANGLEWDLARLVVFDADGKGYYGEDLAAGEAQSLRPITDAEVGRMIAAINANAPQVPPNLPPQYSSSYGHYSYRYSPVTTSFATSLVEQRLRGLARSDAWSNKSQRRTYIAVLEQPPGVDIGQVDASDEAPLHVLIGYY